MNEEIRMIVVVVVTVGGTFVLVYATIMACRAWCHRGGRIMFRERNNNEMALGYFAQVVKAAENRLIIHDDGDNVADTPYNNEYLLGILAQRLETCHQLEVKVLFNVKDENLLIVPMANDYGPRLQIRYKDQRPTSDIHYKIADDTIGYFSEHAQGSSDRKMWVYDFTDTTETARERAFGTHSRLFEREFAQAMEYRGDRCLSAYF